MFEIPRRPRSKINLALAASFLAHCLVCFVLLYREPAFVKSSSVAWGRQGMSTAIVYAPPKLELPSSEAQPKLQFKRRARARQKPSQVVESARAGTPDGSSFSGSTSGVEAKPALPLVFPDPAVYPWQLAGLKGDVVIEVTIDEHGDVSETRVLQSLKSDVDAKCVATLREWRFRPATVDGVAIPSRQDVHFHFPS